jgi:cyclase
MFRKALSITALFILFLLAPLAMAAGEGASGAGPERPQIKEIAPGVYAYIGGGGSTNSGFVITEKGVIVIDSQGPRPRAQDLLARIREKTDKPVTYTINTHYHGDHTFGNQYFKGTIIAHENTRRLLISQDRAHRARFKKFFGPDSLVDFRLTLPDVTFRYEMRLYEDGREMIIRHTGPAHTHGDAFVYLPAEGVVFTGDILYKGRLPWLGEGSVAGTIRALDEMLDLGAKTFVPGHGGLATEKDVLTFRAYLQDLVKEVKRLHDEGKTLEEIKSSISLPAYSGYVKYDEWLPQNAEAVYKELYAKGKATRDQTP